MNITTHYTHSIAFTEKEAREAQQEWHKLCDKPDFSIETDFPKIAAFMNLLNLRKRG